MPTRRQFPIGEQDFANIRNRDMVYNDKTYRIYNIVSKSGKFFFRPCSFGISLLLSIMRYYFEGRHDLIEGMEIDSLEKNGKTSLHLPRSKQRKNFSRQQLPNWTILKQKKKE